MGAAPCQTKHILLESHLPQAVREQWTVEKYAEVVNIHPQTISKFLKEKGAEARENSQRVLFSISADAGAIFHEVATRQLRRLQRLNVIPDTDWTVADYKLEKHTMALIKPLLEWSKLPAVESSRVAESPQLSDAI